MFWPQMMKAAGYQTYMTGKWHVRVDTEQLFDVSADVTGGMPRQTKDRYDRAFDPKEPYADWSPWDESFGGFWKGGKHWSVVQGDNGIEFLNTAAQNEDPFFIYLAFNAPHDPRQSPKEYVDKYTTS